MTTRLIDIAFAIIGLFFLVVLFPVVALLIKLDSRGPVFFKCARVGKDGKIFHMYKFRTMYESDIKLGQSVSPQRDPRVTPVGRILRRLKLNEFPQFLNILRGEMTLVGPRPEAPDLAAAYPLEARRIFRVQPGLVGPNQILGRNEEEFYPHGVDPKEYYLTKLLPRKIPLDLKYIDEKSFLVDLKYLFLGMWVTLTGMVRLQHLWANKDRLLLLMADSAFCLISFMLAYFIRYETFTPGFITQAHLLQILPFTALAHIPFLLLLGCYSGVIDFFGINDIKKIFKGLILGTLTLLLFSLIFQFTKKYGSSIFIINFLCLSVFLIGYRIFLPTLDHFYKRNNGQKTRRVLIIGAGEEGLLCLHYLKKSQDINYQVMGFIDEDSHLQYKNINGIRVIGNLTDLEILLPLYKIDEVFIADSIKQPEQGIRVQKICRKNFVTLTSFVPNQVITRPFVYPQKPAPSIS
jgi:lipopolysaccharide/colanic/teichoic acid biosynthesis glycosyltransferase